MKEKKPAPKPVWWKNTYFWIGGLLLIVAVIGLIGGDAAVRDPGQKRESHLWLLYFGAGAVMLANGWLSHRQTVRTYSEENSA